MLPEKSRARHDVLCMLIFFFLVGSLGIACTPDVASDLKPAYLEFDTDTSRIPQPTAILINPQTGMIDLGLFGYEIPDKPGDCLNLSPAGMSSAECEFYQFMESLDGFPTVMGIEVPASHTLDMHTVSLGENLIVVDVTRNALADNIVAEFDSATNYLRVERKGGWEVGHTYIAGVRGYDDGVKASDGSRVVGPYVYSLLKRTESLVNCEPDGDLPPGPPGEVDPECMYYQLVASLQGDSETPALLYSLEVIRQSLLHPINVWTVLQEFGLQKDQAAIGWIFPIHSASVAELQPAWNPPQVPVVDYQSNKVNLTVKGSIDEQTIRTWTLSNPDGTVFLINTTKLQQLLTILQEAGINLEELDLSSLQGFIDIIISLPALMGKCGFLFSKCINMIQEALPSFDVKYVDQSLELTSQTDLIPEDLYVVLLATEAEDGRAGITDPDGKPLVPSPVTVLLRSRFELVDQSGHSLVSAADDETAHTLEEARILLQELIDNDLIGLTRENIAYLFAFPQ